MSDRQVFQTPPREIISGNANGLPAGSVIAGPALHTIPAKSGSISAQLTVLAQTTSLSFTPSWQVANKQDFSDAQVIETGEIGSVHAAEATGTSGTDVAVTRAVPAPSAVSGFKFVRLALTTAGATGAAQDTYSITMAWCEPNSDDILFGNL